MAQTWANQLAQTGILRYKRDPKYGESIFCRNIALAVRTRQILPDITGEEVAAYWYSNVRQYRFNLSDTALHAHAGSYSQMVWKDSKKFGVGKALSRSGKLIVVAYYYPAGNISNNFRGNVRPLSTRALAAEMICQGQALMEEEYVEPEDEVVTLHKALMNVSAGVTGVLSAQTPNIKGINATKILAAHMLGHAATVVTTPDEKLEVVIVSRKSLKKSKSKIKEQIRELSATSPTLSHLGPMSGKMKRGDVERQCVERALKEVLNMQLKDSLSAPNILSYSGGRSRHKLSEGKRLKFKSEEALNIRERCKGVQTSFSSENLSIGNGNMDYSSSRVSSPFVGSGESLPWSEIMLSEEASLGRMNDRGKNSSESMFSSSSEPRATLNSSSKNHSYPTSFSPISTADASSSPGQFSFGDFISVSEDIAISPSKEVKAKESPNDTSTRALTYTPQMCNLRHCPKEDMDYNGLRDSMKYGSPCQIPTKGKVSNSNKSEDTRSANLKLPFDSPQTESGVMNCYALSPLHY